MIEIYRINKKYLLLQSHNPVINSCLSNIQFEEIFKNIRIITKFTDRKIISR